MGNDFKSKDAAEKELSDNHPQYIQESNRFCPLARCKCDVNCVCWVSPRVKAYRKTYEDKYDTYSIAYGYCGNPMFSG
jgi:hypothetical protein